MSATKIQCPDCGLFIAAPRGSKASRVDPKTCGARFSTHCELQCKRLAVVQLRHELAAERDKIPAVIAEIRAALAEHCGTGGGWRVALDEVEAKLGPP